MLVLPLVVQGAEQRRRLEKLFGAMHSIKRALQRDVMARLRAYWAGSSRLREDAGAWREELGLTRERLERRAYRHLERSGWLLGHASKALAMHQADEVWAGVVRHLFGDRDGRRSGRPRVGRWWDYRRIPGRARSHTTERKWETFRLFGTLHGHLATHRHPELSREVTSPLQAAGLALGTRVLAQPRHPRPCVRPASWWDHTGPLVLVYNGGPASRAGELVLPVRLPQGAGRWPHLVHHLDRPERWHKVDLVRRRDASAEGGWAYEAHLMVLGPGYCSPATTARRQQAAGLERVGGVDGNVSNLAVVSFPRSHSPADGEVASTRVTLSDEERARLTRQRRAAAGLHERRVSQPGGARLADTRGKPRQPYREDALSGGHRRLCGEHAEAAAGVRVARTQRARRLAAAIVSVHGPHLTIEEGDVSAWFRLWGRACLAFTPGRLISALADECAACGGALVRVSTARTALSQHCLCGARVAKTLGQRTHACPACGLTGDRDLVSAALAAFATLGQPGDPTSARVDYQLSGRAQRAFGQRLQAAVAESTALRPMGAAAARPRSPNGGRGRASARPHAGHCVVPTSVGSIVSPPRSHVRNPGTHNGQNLWVSA